MAELRPPEDRAIFSRRFLRLGLLPIFLGVMSEESAQGSIQVVVAQAVAAQSVQQVLGDIGSLEFTSADHVVGVVGTGLWKMNPSIVRVHLTAENAGATRLEIRAVAKQGRLVKSHGGTDSLALFTETFVRWAPPGWQAKPG